MRRASRLAVGGILLSATCLALAQTTQPATQPGSVAPVNKTCPVVAGDPVDPTVFIMHEGKKIGFCCSDCIDEFKKDPAKYLKNLR